MGLDRPIKTHPDLRIRLCLDGRHSTHVAHLGNPPEPTPRIKCDLAPWKSDRTPTVLACIHCVVPKCSLHPSARQALSGSHLATHQYPQQFCIPFVSNIWDCFPPVPSASVLQPVLVPQICLVFLLCRRTPGDLRPVRINSKTSWASSPSQPSCRESFPDGLGSSISLLNRNVHT